MSEDGYIGEWAITATLGRVTFRNGGSFGLTGSWRSRSRSLLFEVAASLENETYIAASSCSPGCPSLDPWHQESPRAPGKKGYEIDTRMENDYIHVHIKTISR